MINIGVVGIINTAVTKNDVDGRPVRMGQLLLNPFHRRSMMAVQMPELIIDLFERVRHTLEMGK